MVQEPTEEAPARACFHGVPVEGCAGLRETGREEGVRASAGRLADSEQILRCPWASAPSPEKWDSNPTSQDYREA